MYENVQSLSPAGCVTAATALNDGCFFFIWNAIIYVNRESDLPFYDIASIEIVLSLLLQVKSVHPLRPKHRKFYIIFTGI